MSELHLGSACNLAVSVLDRCRWLLFAPVLLLAVGQFALWSGYWWIGGRVQAAAEEGARAAGASTDPIVQEALARRAAARRLPGDEFAQASRVILQRRPDGLLVQVAYDASGWRLYRLRYIFPAPPVAVVRVASAPLP